MTRRGGTVGTRPRCAPILLGACLAACQAPPIDLAPPPEPDGGPPVGLSPAFGPVLGSPRGFVQGSAPVRAACGPVVCLVAWGAVPLSFHDRDDDQCGNRICSSDEASAGSCPEDCPIQGTPGAVRIGLMDGEPLDVAPIDLGGAPIEVVWHGPGFVVLAGSALVEIDAEDGSVTRHALPAAEHARATSDGDTLFVALVDGGGTLVVAGADLRALVDLGVRLDFAAEGIAVSDEEVVVVGRVAGSEEGRAARLARDGTPIAEETFTTGPVAVVHRGGRFVLISQGRARYLGDPSTAEVGLGWGELVRARATSDGFLTLVAEPGGGSYRDPTTRLLASRWDAALRARPLADRRWDETLLSVPYDAVPTDTHLADIAEIGPGRHLFAFVRLGPPVQIVWRSVTYPDVLE